MTTAASMASALARRRRKPDDLARMEQFEAAIPKPKFIVPLKAGVSAEAADADKLCRVVESEYNTRLLESLGAAPSKANLELVKKYVPLDPKCLKVSARTKGYMMDQLEMEPPTVKHDYKVAHLGVRAKPHEMVTLGIMQGRMNDDRDRNVDHCFERLADMNAELIKKEVIGETVSEFSKKSRQFVFPYCLEKKPPANFKELLKVLKTQDRDNDEDLPGQLRGVVATASSPPPPAAAAAATQQGGPSHTGPRRPPRQPPGKKAAAAKQAVSAAEVRGRESVGRGGGSMGDGGSGGEVGTEASTRSLHGAASAVVMSLGALGLSAGALAKEGSREAATDAFLDKQRNEFKNALQRERTKTLNVAGSGLVERYQEKFCRDLVEWKAKEISEDTLRNRITDEDFIECIRELGSPRTIRLFSNVMQLLYNLHLKGVPLTNPVQEELAYTVHQDFALLQAQYRKRKSHMVFTMPISLLALRACVEQTFSTHYPMWESTPEGKEAVRQMDSAIIEMLDPHSYYSDLSLFQSTPAAIHMLQGAHKQARKLVRERFYCMSPLNRAVVGTPASGAARKFLGQEARGKMRLAGGYGRTGTSAVELEGSGSPVGGSSGIGGSTALPLPRRKHLAKLNLELVRAGQAPFQGADHAPTKDRGEWLHRETHAGCKGL